MNLLPDTRKQALVRLYLTRVGVVAALLLSGVFLVHATLSLPSYVYLHQVIAERTQELSGLGEQLAGSKEREVSARVATLNASATYLSQTQSRVTASGAVRAIGAVPHPGVKLIGFSFSQPLASANAPKMTLTGNAGSRETLRAYVSALGTLPYISKVDLPISAYAKETDIDFTITLSGTFLP